MLPNLGHYFGTPKLEHARPSIIFAQKPHLMNGEIDMMMNKVLKNWPMSGIRFHLNLIAFFSK